MPSTDTLKPVEPNDKLLYIPHQNMDIDNIIRDAPGRIILSMPSSSTTQIKSAIRAVARCKRKLVPVGQGIKKGVNKVLRLQASASSRVRQRGSRRHSEVITLQTDRGIVISINEGNQLPPEKVVIVATGSQGEGSSALARIANGAHTDVQIMSNDTIVIVTMLTPDKIGPVEIMANKLIHLNATVTIYHSLPMSLPLPKVREDRPFLKSKKKRSSSKKTKTQRISSRKVVRMTYAELRPVLERRAADKTKPNRLSPEGPYGSWGLSIPREER